MPKKKPAEQKPDRTRAGRRHLKLEERRLALRDQLWPDASGQIWSRHSNKGFTTIPRLLPLIMVLIKELSQTGNASSVYLDLWSRAFDEGFVSINHEADHAYASGYSGTRGVRTWRERIFALQELGFIKTKATGAREYAHVLLVDPLQVVVQLRNEPRSRVPEVWWIAFVTRADEIGAKLPDTA